MRETELHHPIATWLEAQGYRVSAEVNHCDIVARREDEDEDEAPVIVELKTRISLDLIIQGVRRQEISPSVYLAVPLKGARSRLNNQSGIRTLLRRLGIGLLVVRTLRQGTRVEVFLHPGDYPIRSRPSRQRAIIREIDGRYAELNTGGQTSGETRWSAFRQRSLVIAAIMARDPQRLWAPRDIRAAGGPPQTGAILSANHLGWFERIARGAYRISAAGCTVVDTHHDRAEQLIQRATS